MACYLIANGGNWTDTTKWAASDADAATNTNSGATPTASDDVFLTANSGQCTISATSVGKSLTCTGYTNTLTHNNVNLTVSGNATFVAGMTYTTSALTTNNLVFNANATLTTGGVLMARIAQSGGTTLTLGDNLAFTAVKTNQLQIINTLDVNGKTVTGNSATNRPLITTNTLGTPRTITNALATTFNNVDFRDITFTTAGALDLSNSDANSVGNCGGNTASGGALTFTTAATQTATGSSANWSTATWSGRVPLPQDTTVISLTAGQTLTVDMPRIGSDLSFGTATHLTLGNAVTSYGSVNLTGMGTFSGAFDWTFEGRSINYTLTNGGKVFPNSVVVQMISGTLTLQDAFSVGANKNLTVTAGTFSDGGFSVAVTNQLISTGTITRGITRSGTWTFNSGAVITFWNISGSGLTINDTGTTFVNSSDANAKTFAGNGLSYNDLKMKGGGGTVLITGANTLNRIYTDGGGTKSITLPGSTTTTILSGLGLNNGTNLITFTASAGSATVSHASGNLAWDYVSLTNIISTGGGTFYAGPLTHSTDGGGNTGWIFDTAPPDGGVTSSYNNLLLYFFQ